MNESLDKKKRFNSIQFDKIPKRFDTDDREKYWSKRWENLKIHKRDRDAIRKRSFAIDSPPPTVSGSLHVGHVFSYTHQDLLARYKRMAGWNVIYPMGWDDNGLPTERRVQNYFNVRAEPGVPYIADLNVDTERKNQNLKKNHQLVISRQNFIDLCHQITALDEVAFKNLFDRMAFSIDWTDEYSTIDKKSRRIAQRSFNDLFDKNEIYQNESPTMWDIDFQTAVAQAEIEDREVKGAYHEIEFAVLDESDIKDSFVISTTRPELLAACVGVAAHPNDERYKNYFGKEALTPVFFSKVPIFPSELADPNKGTGILMVCTFGDQTDVHWWREHSLRLRQVLSKDGKFLNVKFGEAGWESIHPEIANVNYQKLVNKRTAAAKKELIILLRDKNNSATGNSEPLQSEPKEIVHPVRFFEKGDSPIEYLASRQWFVKTMDKREELITMGNRIKWYPEFMLKRFENWTDNLNVDWCISRQRFFGVPIPVWYPIDVDGKVDYDTPIRVTDDALPVDPSIDVPNGYTEMDRNKPGGFIGETDILDTWFTSSLTPQIVGKWLDHDDEMNNIFPMDIRPQSHEIIRTWAFYTIVKSFIHHKNIPWKSVVISGWVLDPDRKKMSKSRGNVVVPTDILDRFGSDAVRYWAASFRLGSDATNDEKIFKVGTKLVTKLYNAAKFVLSQTSPVGETTYELDKAFINDLKITVDKATNAFERYEFSLALQEVEKFFWGSFTDNYIELVKNRSRDENDIKGRSSAVTTLRLSLNILLRLFAPFVPTITDEIWSWVYKLETSTDSIHLSKWPQMNELDIVAQPDNKNSFSIACDAISSVRKAKSQAGVGMGRPLKQLNIFSGTGDWNNLNLVLNDVLAAAGTSNVEHVVENVADSLIFRSEVVIES